MRGNDQYNQCTLRGEARLRFKSEFEETAGDFKSTAVFNLLAEPDEDAEQDEQQKHHKEHTTDQ